MAKINTQPIRDVIMDNEVFSNEFTHDFSVKSTKLFDSNQIEWIQGNINLILETIISLMKGSSSKKSINFKKLNTKRKNAFQIRIKKIPINDKRIIILKEKTKICMMIFFDKKEQEKIIKHLNK